MRKGILDALYWRLHAFYLRNERKDAIKALILLDDEISNGGSLLSEIGPIHFERFKTISSRVKDNSFARITGDGVDATFLEPLKQDIENTPEKEFCKTILKEKTHIYNAVGVSSKAIITTEVDVDPYGRIDIRFVENRVVKILEVKTKEAESSLVSQIDKYRVAIELDMCLGLYDQVEAYVLANAYNKYMISELTRASVVVLTHTGTPESIRRIA